MQKEILMAPLLAIRAHLVAKGFHQCPMLTFMTLPLLDLVLLVVLSQYWPFCQLDMNSVFLHGTLFEDVHMS